MMVARIIRERGQILLIGLSRENVKRMLAGQPVRITNEKHKAGLPEDWEIAIMFGETEQDMYNMLQKSGLVRPDTEMILDPRLGIDPKQHE